MHHDYIQDSSDCSAYDLLIIGGGINGCGIARDAAGRGLKVALSEMNDLASATSSSSTKLLHGGLRYLEYFEFRLVKESLIEREILLHAMPHISWPIRFVLPYHSGMRFNNTTPVSRLLSIFMPWMNSRRPAYLIRLGLFLYDTLGGRKLLPGTRTIDLTRDPAGKPLKDIYKTAFEYSDCWVQDSRLVVLNARDAHERGATIMTYTKVQSAIRNTDHWMVSLLNVKSGDVFKIKAKTLVNAGGPWVNQIYKTLSGLKSAKNVRLVRGSHIVIDKLYDHEKCYVFQGSDGRIVFAIPYEEDFTLIGTTDVEHYNPHVEPVCSNEEKQYLLDNASNYFHEKISSDDIRWTFSGIRQLSDYGRKSASAATRDYELNLDESGGAPVLNIYGGKLTTYRKLAEVALEMISPFFPNCKQPWTSCAPLPGGNFELGQVNELVITLCNDYKFLSESWSRRLLRTYGTDAWQMLGDAMNRSDLGIDFGATVTSRELDWTIDKEWVQCAEDFAWRRTRLGLRLIPDELNHIDSYIRKTLHHTA